MAHYVLWFDSDNAHVFHFGDSEIAKTNIKRKASDHHTFNKKDHHGDPSIHHYYEEVIKEMPNPEEVLVLGPGLGKQHFMTFVKANRPELNRAIVGVENSDHLTDNQILAFARKFFKTFNLFNNPIRQGAKM